MKLIDLNRQGGIGANSMYIRIGCFNILIDAGLNPKELGYLAMPDFQTIRDIDLDLIVLTHCHLDHLGSLPIIAAQNPETPVITAIPNIKLAPRMLRNSINVMKRQREEHAISEYPLFVHRDVIALNRQMTPQHFGCSETYTKGSEKIDITLHSSGHIVGAAAVEIVHGERRIVFTGDVLFDHQRTLPGAKLPVGKIDTLVLETTRGSTERAPDFTRKGEIDRLIKKINAVLDRKGSCLIPVFALGRMQELFKIIYEARLGKRIQEAPIYAAGLGMDICNYFHKIHEHTQLVDFSAKMMKKLQIRALDPNMRPGRDLPNKGIYIVSSGMLVEHTPSYRVAASLLQHAQNAICFVGYCDPDTPGGKLVENSKEDHFFFEALNYRSPIRASIDKFDLSGHAERNQLVDYAFNSQAHTVVLTHGSPEARTWFNDTLCARAPDCNVLNPKPLIEYLI